MPEFILEIGTEEVPASAVVPALDQLRDLLRELLERERIEFGEVRTAGTPRRLVAFASDLAERQADAVVELPGPPASIAFDTEGRPTAAAEGFARKNQIKVAELTVRATPRGDYVFGERREEGRPTAAVLGEGLPEIFTALNFPKFMRWGEGRYRFARPIRWILCLLGDKVVPFAIDGLESGRMTAGHRTLSPGLHPVESAEAYRGLLARAQILVDPQEREQAIVEQGNRLAAAEGLRAVWDAELLREVTFMVEHPTAVLGRFDPDYLRLPRPVLVSAMRKHQRYFTLEGPGGELAPRFLAIRNGGDRGLEVVREGNERVLAFRFNDAVFYYDEDRKTPLAEKRERLRGIVFLEGMGSLFDKSQRLVQTAAALCGDLEEPALGDAAGRAAALCKADLASQMVVELPELQGIMGCEYALLDGEPPEVAAAIGEHYRPRSVGDALPESLLGKILSLADRLDTLAAAFAIGLTPSGSFDPLGLRRQAAGVVALLAALPPRLSIAALVDRVRQALATCHATRETFNTAGKPEREGAEAFAFGPARAGEDVGRPVTDPLLALLAGRLQAALIEEDIRSDLTLAVLAAGWDCVPHAFSRARFLQESAGLDPEGFERLVTVATRVRNIVRPTQAAAADPSLLEHPTEKSLAAAAAARTAGVRAAAREGDWRAVWDACDSLRGAIDQFFVDVLVMAEDPGLRAARLGLLRELDGWFLSLADFSRVVSA